MKILVVNAGSSSLKFQLFDVENNYAVVAKGLCDNVGLETSKLKYTKTGTSEVELAIAMPNHSVATKTMSDALTGALSDKGFEGCIASMDEIGAVGHRVVHGGPYFSQSVVINDEVIEKLRSCVEYAPLHTMPHIMGINGCTEVMPGIPQVLVFDTAFHSTMPAYAKTYAIPYEMTSEGHIYRYGAHGTSHRFVTGEMCKLLGRTENTKIVTCHLGNGSSISAVKDGKVIDTSMGLTPLAGVEMGTRCGDIDPAIVPLMMEKYDVSVDKINNFMNKKCGLLGVSGVSSDARDIEAAIRDGNENALLAANILAYGIKKYIGSYVAALNGVDAVVFTAGMGENNVELRERVCKDMDFFGIKLDDAANKATVRKSEPVKLSTDDSKVLVYMIPTNEELMIARDTEALVKAK